NACRYDRRLDSGTILASGTLGILITPSMRIVIYGPMAGLSVGQLFASTLLPGLVLASFYFIFVLVICALYPTAGPPLSGEDRALPVSYRIQEFLRAAVPTLSLIVAVLGSILAGIASPTEAAAVGAAATILLAALYRQFT